MSLKKVNARVAGDKLMQAIEFPNAGRIIFSSVPVPVEFRDEIQKELGGRIREEIVLDPISPELFHWPDGTPAPEAILCVSRTDPNHYKVFKYSSEIDHCQFEVAGLNWGRIGAASAWQRFMENIRQLNQIAREAKGVETPDDEDAAVATGRR